MRRLALLMTAVGLLACDPTFPPHLDAGADGGPPDACQPMTWCRDHDGDGFPTPYACLDACESPGGDYIETSGVGPWDCVWDDPDSNPDASETCDHEDNDCDGQADEAPATGTTAYCDADGVMVARVCSSRRPRGSVPCAE